MKEDFNTQNSQSNQSLQSSQYTLLNISNFNKKMTSSVEDVLEKYMLVVIEYKNFISEKIVMKNKKHFEFIYRRGLDTISHVFSMILFYTKNLDITYYHSQKSFYFFVEFIEQIIDIQHSFLQLSSRDASVFVYKKTIYEINNEYRKSVENDKDSNAQDLEIINLYIEIYKLLVGLTNNQFNEICLKLGKNSAKHDKKIIKLIYLYAEKMMEDRVIVAFDTFLLLLNNLEKYGAKDDVIMNLTILILENEPITETVIKNMFE